MMIKGRVVSALAHRAASAHSALRRAMVAAAALTLLVAMSVSTAMAFVIPSPGSITGKEKTEDDIVVANFGGLLGGSWVQFNSPTAGGNIIPNQAVGGSNTVLFGVNGIAGSPLAPTLGDIYAVSSIIPLVPATSGVFGFASGDNGNPTPQVLLGCLPGFGGYPKGCHTGFDLPDGVTFGSTTATVCSATSAGACVATETQTVTPGLLPSTFEWVTNNLPVIHAALPPTAKNICSVGTVGAFPPFSFFNTPPTFDGDPIFAPGTPVPVNDGLGTLQDATIGGCNAGFLLPVGIQIDALDDAIFVVNNGSAGVLPGFVEIFDPSNTFTVCVNTGSVLASTPPCNQIAAFGWTTVLAEPTPGVSGYGNVGASGAYGVKPFFSGQLTSPYFIALDHHDGLGYVSDVGTPGHNAKPPTGTPPQINVFSYKPSWLVTPGVSSVCPDSTVPCDSCPAGDIPCVNTGGATCCGATCPFGATAFPGAGSFACTAGPLFFPTPKGRIQGSATALQFPEGVALGAGLDDLYVASEGGNKVEFFDFPAPISGTQNLSPDVVITGFKTRLNQPTGLSMNCADDPLAPQCTAGCPLGEVFNPTTGACAACPKADATLDAGSSLGFDPLTGLCACPGLEVWSPSCFKCTPTGVCVFL